MTTFWPGALWTLGVAVLSWVLSFFCTRRRDNKIIEASIRNSVVSIHEDLESLWRRINLAQGDAKNATPSMDKVTTRLDENLASLGQIIQKLGNYIRYSCGKKKEYWGRLESQWKEEQSSGYDKEQVQEIRRKLQRKKWPWTMRTGQDNISIHSAPPLGEHL